MKRFCRRSRCYAAAFRYRFRPQRHAYFRCRLRQARRVDMREAQVFHVHGAAARNETRDGFGVTVCPSSAKTTRRFATF